ncbi:hypothetical protein [Flavobacterium alkalisoli]|uniref:hypothetical protein n=1 Tax=Flavobacterium alkalisoli TaxID=2602769 RepID=UPI003A916AD8
MIEHIKRNRKALSNTFALFFSSFFIPVFIIMLLTGNLRLKLLLFVAVLSIAIALFIPLYLLFLFSIGDYKEKRFFSKSPYDYIERNLIEHKYDKESSRFSLYKKRLVFNHKGTTYSAIYYTDVYRNYYGNALLIIKHEDDDTNIVSSIEYKNQELSEKEFIEELENIEIDESRTVLRDI